MTDDEERKRNLEGPCGMYVTDQEFLAYQENQANEVPPWLEVWSESDDGIIKVSGHIENTHKTRLMIFESRFAWEQGCNVGAFGDMGGASPFNPEPKDIARARLSSAAPDMARLLLRSLEDGATTEHEMRHVLEKAGVL